MPIAALCVEIGEKEANNLREILDFDKKLPQKVISEIVSNSTGICLKVLSCELIFFETKTDEFGTLVPETGEGQTVLYEEKWDWNRILSKNGLVKLPFY